MNRDATGTYRITATAGEPVRAFVPQPLPPVPPLEIAGPRQLLLERATLAVGRHPRAFAASRETTLERRPAMKPGYKQTEVGVIPEEWDDVLRQFCEAGKWTHA